jgi:hypothetical protein
LPDLLIFGDLTSKVYYWYAVRRDLGTFHGHGTSGNKEVTVSIDSLDHQHDVTVVFILDQKATALR